MVNEDPNDPESPFYKGGERFRFGKHGERIPVSSERRSLFAKVRKGIHERSEQHKQKSERRKQIDREVEAQAQKEYLIAYKRERLKSTRKKAAAKARHDVAGGFTRARGSRRGRRQSTSNLLGVGGVGLDFNWLGESTGNNELGTGHSFLLNQIDMSAGPRGKKAKPFNPWDF